MKRWPPCTNDKTMTVGVKLLQSLFFKVESRGIGAGQLERIVGGVLEARLNREEEHGRNEEDGGDMEIQESEEDQGIEDDEESGDGMEEEDGDDMEEEDVTEDSQDVEDDEGASLFVS